MNLPLIILLDIEGTVSPISYVKEVLFPYAKDRIADFVHNYQKEPWLQNCFQMTADTVRSELQRAINWEEAIEVWKGWIDTDRKHTALKEIQGQIWKQAFESGTLVSELYPDVLPALLSLKSQGKSLNIYSSGSITAQKQFFSFTSQGNLLHLFEHFFDTTIGQKKEADSYRGIARALAQPVSEIVFFSDVEAELNAAQKAGLQTIQVVREGTEPSQLHLTIPSFDCFVKHVEV